MMTALLIGLATIAGTLLIIVFATGASGRRKTTGGDGSVAYMGNSGADCAAGSDGGCDGGSDGGGGCDGGGGGD